MDIEKNSTEISSEISATLKLMKKAKTADDKLKYSEAVKNLCESLGIFFDFFETIAPFGCMGDDDELEEIDDDAPIPF